MARKIDTDAEIDRVRIKQQMSHPSAPSGGYEYLYIVSGTTHGGLFVEDSGGRKIGPFITGTSGGGLSYISKHKRTAGDYTLNNTSWTNVDTGTDLSLTVVAGDIIEVGINALMGAEAVNAALDVATIVGGSPVNYLGTSGGGSDLGIQGWLGLSGVNTAIGGPFLYTIQAGDISSGTVTLRLRYRTTAASNKTVRANSTQPFLWYAKNLSR